MPTHKPQYLNSSAFSLCELHVNTISPKNDHRGAKMGYISVLTSQQPDNANGAYRLNPPNTRLQRLYT